MIITYYPVSDYRFNYRVSSGKICYFNKDYNLRNEKNDLTVFSSLFWVKLERKEIFTKSDVITFIHFNGD